MAKTIKIKNNLLIDVDEKRKILGIEILDLPRQIPKEEIGKFPLKCQFMFKA